MQNLEQEKLELIKRAEKIKSVLDENKAEEIEFFNLIETDYFVEGVVIATSLGDRHNEALLDFLKKELKPEESFLNTEISDGWIVVDLGDMLVHIMTPKYREIYQLEKFLSEFNKQK
jgi:ribosome-associated protein